MATIDEINIIINAEDRASAVIASVGSNIGSLSTAEKGLASELLVVGKAQSKETRGLSEYKKQMQEAQNTLNTSRTALNSTKKAYEDNQKSITNNVAALKQQKSSLEGLIATKHNEINALEHANTIVNKGSVAYNDNLKAIQWTQTELSSLEQQHRSVTNSMLTQEATLAGSKKAYEDAQTSVERAEKQIAGYEKGLKAVERAERASQLQDRGKRWKEMGEGIDQATKPFQAASVAILGLGTASAMAAVNFEDNFAAVKKTVDGTPEQLDAIKQSIIDMTTVGINGHNAIPLTTAELTELAAAGGQLGISTEGIVDFTETMAMLGTATNLIGEQGAATIARFQNVMQIPESEIRNVGSAIVDLGNNSATTEAEIAAMALRMGKYGQTVGMSAADVLGYSAALSSMGIEAQLGGSAVGRTWLSIETAVAKGGKELQAFAKYSGKSAQEFKEQWNTDSKGAFNGLLKGLKAADNLTLALSDIGINNTQDIQAMQALVNGYDLVVESVDRANTAYKENTALQDEFNAKVETTASKLAVAKSNAVEVARSFGEIMLPTIVDVTGGLSSMMQGMAKWNDGTKKAVVSAGAFVVGLGAVSKGAAGTIKTVGGVIDGVGKIKGALLAIRGVGSAAAGEATASIVGIGEAAASALAPVGALAALMAVVGVKEKYFNYNRGMLEAGEDIQTAANGLSEYVNLIDEVNKNKLIIKSDDSSKEEIEAAKKRIEEIAEMLGIEYSMDIDVDTTALDEALEKEAELKRTDIINNSSKYLDKLYKGEKSYSHDKDLVEDYEKKKSVYEATINKYGNLAAQAKRAKAAFDRERIDETEYTRRAQSIYDQAIAKGYKFAQPELQNGVIKTEFAADILVNGLTGDANFSSAALNTIEKEASDAKERMNELEESARNTGNAFTQALAADVKNGDAFGIETDIGLIQDLSEEMTKLGIPTTELGIQFAAARMGYTDFNTALGEGGKNAQQMAQYFIEYEQSIGASANETVTGAALIQNGFRTIKEAAQAGKLDIISQQATEIARSMGEIPNDKRIEISATGDISLIDEATNKVERIQNDNITVTVNADGDISIIDEATGKEQALNGLGDVHIQINGDGDIEILDEAEQKIAEIDGESGEITVNGEYPGADEIKKAIEDQNKVEKKETNLKVNGEYPGKKDVAQALSDQEALTDKTVTYTVNYVQNGTKPKENATGTQNFEGGLAMVNDQRGISDPRELIVDKGRAFIPEGRDVILPLSKGAKVYTAAQTRAIMSGLGVPRYASGKNNSDAFTSARDDWQHYTKTHAVTITQELEKWIEFQEKYKENEKDIWDIEEQIFSLRQRQYSEQLSNMEKQLNHQEKYNGMSVTDYMAGIDDMRAYTTEYYEKGIISHKEYLDKMIEYDEKYLDKAKEGIAKQFDISKSYISDRTYFNDWGDNGDSPLEAYNRVKEQRQNDLAEGKLTQDEYDEYMSTLGSDMLKERIEQSKRWLEEQRKYFGMSDADYAAGIERIKNYTQEYLDAGIIGAREFNEAMTDLNHMAWDEAENAYEEALQKQQEYISEMRDKFSKEEQTLRDSWDVADRAADMSDVQRQLDIYKGAVTDRGQQKYKELQEQMKKLQRDEEMYNLQVKNNATINDLEADYKKVEDAKKATLAGIARTNIDVSGFVSQIESNLENSTTDMTRLLNDLIDAVNNKQLTVNTTEMSDSRHITNYISAPVNQIGEIARGNLLK